MKPKVGQKVTRSDGASGRIVKIVDEDLKWGGPWTAQIEYQPVFENHILHDWVTAQEWEEDWK